MRATQKSSTLNPGEIRHRVDAALGAIRAPAQRRLLRHLMGSPGARTDSISRECGIGYVPSTVWKANRVLPQFGLHIVGHPLRACRNRFGQIERQFSWRIELLNPKGVF